MDFRGVLPPLSTPFRQERVDLGALRDNVARYAQTSLRGFVVLGSNGEAPFVDEDEAERIIAAARAATPSDRLLVAGTGRESTYLTIDATRRAAAAGADAVLVRTPSFFKSAMTADAFVHHYVALADASPVPILLYNFPALTGVNLPVAAVAELAKHPNVVGLKESGGDVAQLSDFVAHVPAHFAVLVGSGPHFYAGPTVGATGGILALAAVVPELCVRVFTLVREQRLAEALALQRHLVPLARAITARFGVPGLKVAVELAGYVGGDPRSPLAPAPPEAREVIRQQLLDLGVLHN
jgi:4-hydroxy-2-oxoglutarate aldolase